jgi:hypothetical protein
MSLSRTIASVVAGTALLFGGLAMGVPGHVSATTGPTQFLPAPKFKVSNALEAQFVGQYILKSVAPASRLSGGALGVEVDDDNGALVGVAQFYGYDAQGQQTVWVATMYDFHLVKAGEIDIDLVGPSGKPLLGRLYVTRNKTTGDLTGSISLGASTQKFSIVWHKISSK